MDKYLARVLFIDLSAHRYWVEERGELFRARLGGTGVAVELLHELCPAGADPLAAENPVIFAVGPLSALFPLASKTVALFKSPHTGKLGESHCGGRSAVALRLAGYGAVVIIGKGRVPVADPPGYSRLYRELHERAVHSELFRKYHDLGTMLGGEDPEGFLRLMDTVEHLGLDAMSCGVALAWATEAFERGLITDRDTGGLVPKWGDYGVYREMVWRIARGDGELYEHLARGVTAAAARYGGEEFALAFGGNEMAGYHTGPGAYLTHLLGARHSHLDSAGYAVDQADLREGRERSPEELARALFSEEARRQVLSSLVVCFFARGLYDLDTASRCLSVLGEGWDGEGLRTLGEKILRRKYAFKLREGFDPVRLHIPARIAETPSPHGAIDPGYLREAAAALAALLTSSD